MLIPIQCLPILLFQSSIADYMFIIICLWNLIVKFWTYCKTKHRVSGTLSTAQCVSSFKAFVYIYVDTEHEEFFYWELPPPIKTYPNIEQICLFQVHNFVSLFPIRMAFHLCIANLSGADRRWSTLMVNLLTLIDQN